MTRQLRSVYPLLLLFTAAVTLGDPGSITEVVKKVRPVVVTVMTYDAAGIADSQGSGFFIDSRHVITNWHVVDNASRIDARAADGTTYHVRTIAARDEKTDLVSLELATANPSVSPLAISAAIPEPGERVVVVGSPLGLESSVSDGVVSELRDVPTLGRVMQISAPVSRGSSGSPVVNLNGEVVGVAQAIRADGQNLNFAIPGSRIVALVSRKPRTEGSAPGREGAGPEAIDSDFAKGRALMKAKNYQAAVAAFLSVVQSDPRNYLAWYSAGHCYTQMGDYKQAAEAFTMTVKLRPGFASAHASLGAALGLLGKYPAAINAFKNAIRIEPDNAVSHYGLGLVYVAVKDAESALKEYQILQRLNPRMAADLFNAIY